MSADEEEQTETCDCDTDDLIKSHDNELLAMADKHAMSQFILYKRRWFVLIVVAGLNITNGAIWISFAPISNLAATYFNVSSDDINWLSIVFFISMIPFGILATICTEINGLKTVIHVGASLNFAGAVLRVVASIDDIVPEGYRFPLTMAGQTVAAIGQPFVLLIPTRLSEVWFPENQRTMSTTVASMGNPLGAALGSVISPIILTRYPQQMYIINSIWASAALVFFVATVFGIRSSAPPTPPSTSATTPNSHSFIVGIKQLLTNKDYIVLLIGVGGGVGLISCLQTLIDQFLCPKGYSNEFAGLCSGLFTICGMVATGIVGAIADKTRKLEEIAKICFGFAAMSGAILCVAFQQSNSPYFIAIMCSLFGAFAFASYPVSLELAAETSYPVNEAMSAGFILLSGQVQGIVYILLLAAVGGTLTPQEMEIQTCKSRVLSSSTAHDMKVPGYIFSSAIVFCVCVLIIFYKADYKRMRVEQLRITNTILATDDRETFQDSVTIYD